MEFKVELAYDLYTEEAVAFYEKLGFKFEQYIGNKSIVTKAWPTIELNTLEEFINFIEKWEEVIVSKNTIFINNYYIEQANAFNKVM
jgi:hypothetical protein